MGWSTTVERRHGVSDEPDTTCQYVDAAIEAMETVREANKGLRRWGHEWRDRAVELESELSEAKDDVKRLQGELDVAFPELDALRAERAEWRAALQAETELRQSYERRLNGARHATTD